MYSLFDKLCGGLDVHLVAYIISETVEPFKYRGFHSDSRAFTFLQKIGYPCMGEIMFCSVL